MKKNFTLVLVLATGILFFTLTSKAQSDFSNDWLLRNDLPVFSEPEIKPVQANIYQNGDKVRLAFLLSENPETNKAECELSFDPVYFFVVGTPVLIDPQTEKKRDIDYTFKNEHLFFNVTATNDLKYIEFTVASRKLKNLGTLTAEEKIKQARTIRRIRQQTDSWSPLTADQIIAQPTLRPIISHGGYATDGVKRAIIWANDTKLTGKFELIDALNNVQHPDPQPVVYSGNLIETGNHIWGGNNYIADFSDFKQEGLYFIRLKVNETREISDSYVFPVKKNIYLEVATKAAKWYFYQRCGTEVPGFHKACHTEDAIIKTDGTKVDVTGGWHDAGDYGKWMWGGSMGLFGLTTFQNDFGTELKDTLEGMPRYINEIAWEAEYFCKTYWDGEFHPGFTPNFENVCMWIGAPENEPPRIVSEQECIENSYGIIKGAAICLPGAVLARAGRLLLPYDKKLAGKCLAIAKDVYDRGRKMETSNLYYIESGLLLIDLELYRVYNDEIYMKDARQRVKNILGLQDEEGQFYTDHSKTSKTIRVGMHLPALYEFIKQNPDSESASEIKEAFKLWADFSMQYANLSPFGQIGGTAKDGSVRNIVPHTNNRKLGDVAWALATAAILLEEPKYLEAAEYQIQWILGFNPADVSMMAGVGKGPGCYHHRYSFTEGGRDGVVPGGVMIGINPGNGGILELGDITKNFIIAEVPIDYPIFDTGTWGWTYAYKTSEYACSKNDSFIRGASQIAKALRMLK
jgi:endoglucanase